MSPNKDTHPHTRSQERELKREREHAGVLQTSKTYFIARIRERVYYRREESTKKFQWRLFES